MTKDYYKILGITDSESAVDIKLAYRKLARKWHPDVAGNTPEAINRFKELNEAYEVLSNPIKKSEYDRAKSFYTYARKNTHYKDTKTSQNFKSKEPDLTKSFDEKEKKAIREFVTNDDGVYPAKSPIGMFDLYMPNDLGLVVDKITEYYG